MRGGKRKIVGIAIAAVGVILLLWALPLWMWLALFGLALIVLGVIIFIKKC